MDPHPYMHATHAKKEKNTTSLDYVWFAALPKPRDVDLNAEEYSDTQFSSLAIHSLSKLQLDCLSAVSSKRLSILYRRVLSTVSL